MYFNLVFLRRKRSPEVSFCISKTIVSDSSELNTVKQGREEWRSKCSKISVGRKRSRQNFFFSTNTKYWIFLYKVTIFLVIPLLTIENHFPEGLDVVWEIRSYLFVQSWRNSATFTNSGWGVESQTGLLDFNLQWCRLKGNWEGMMKSKKQDNHRWIVAPCLRHLRACSF